MTNHDRSLKGRCANFKTLLLAFMTLGIIAAGAAIVSFAMMCRYHIKHLNEGGGDTGIKICKAVYRPGDNTVAFAEVLRMVLAFVAIVTVFVFCGVCCCYRLSVARDQNNHLKTLLGSYNLGTASKELDKEYKEIDKEFKFYLAAALDSQATDSMMNLHDKDVKISLIHVPEDMGIASRKGDCWGPTVTHSLLSGTEKVPLPPDDPEDVRLTINPISQDELVQSDSDSEDSDLLTSSQSSVVTVTVEDVHLDTEDASSSLPLVHQFKPLCDNHVHVAS